MDAFEQALLFPTARAGDLAVPPDQAAEWAAAESSFGRVALDELGLSAGMRLHVIQPARRLLSDWRQARAPFDRQIEPHMADLRALATLDAAIADRLARAQDAERQQLDQLEAGHAYLAIRTRFHEAQSRYAELRSRHGLRDATMWGYGPLYLVLLACIGVAEWLINYDTFLIFTGVPAIAAGATIILGILLAYAAHGHGTILKQWSHRFGRERERAQRLGTWRLLGLSTLGLAIVLAAAGGSRYAAALHSLVGNAQPNILGAEAAIDADPLRDVLLSLLANVGAWIVGVFTAYVAHDENPDYMDATRQYRRAERRYLRHRRRTDDQVATIKARSAKEVAELEQRARVKSGAVAAERDLLLQVDAHQDALERAVQDALRAGLEVYRNALARASAEAGREVEIIQAGQPNPVTPYELKMLQPRIDLSFVQGLAA